MIAAIYIAAWLVAAQLLIATIIENSIKHGAYKKSILSKRKYKLFLNDIECSNQEIRMRRINSLIAVTLSQFAEIIYVSSIENKEQNVNGLFVGEIMDEMIEIGTEYVYCMIDSKKH